MQKALSEKFEELEAKAQAADDSDEERLGDQSGHAFSEELADVKRRKQQGEHITETEQNLLNVKWKHLNAQERLPFQKLHQEDR